ncbi:MAG: VCBS repeat-containing protein [Candidatus Pacebacteria bacterium]|nr:VCBS repeat-containing protein [Candidatus Paceibacterota bacterium]
MRKNKFKKLFLANNIGIVFGCVILVLMMILAFLVWQRSHQNNIQKDVVKISKVFYWTGKAGDGKWSTAANWNENRVPGVDAEVIFDATSKEDSFVDAEFYGEISSLQIKGYEEKITQNLPLTITGDYYQESGGYEAVGDLRVQGDFTQTGESFFAVMVGDTWIDGELRYEDGFLVPAEDAAVHVKIYNEWKNLIVNAGGKDDYRAAKESGTGEVVSETWSFYNATNFLRSYISREKGWTLEGVDKAWNWNYVFAGLYRDDEENVSSQNLSISAEENQVILERNEHVEEWYKNTYKGVEQGFTIKSKLIGEGELVLRGTLETNNLYLAKNEEDDITGFLLSNGLTAIKYGHLLAEDARGKNLPVKLDLVKADDHSYELNISVDDKGAEYPIIVDPISTTPDWTGSGGVSSAQYGKVATLAGDVNGDGKSDFLVTARAYTGSYNTEGAAFLYYGTASGVSTTPAWSYISGVAYSHLGHSASAAGDVNDDGYDDIIVAADGWGNYSGRLYLFFGSINGLSAQPDWTYEGTQANQNLGQSVSNAGDINGDGFDDIVAGAHYYTETGLSHQGKAFVFYGNVYGFSNTPDWTVTGGEAGALLGFSVSDAGDVNKDGYSDILIGAPAVGSVNEGKAYLYLGSETGLPSSPSRVFADGTANSYFGNPVSLGGDINNDGYPDVLIGASRYDNIKKDAGAVFAYYGGASGLAASPSWSSYGSQADAYYGCGYYTAGDVNGDGFSDIIVGSCMYDGDLVNEGQASVFLGSAAGLASSPIWTKEGDYTNASFGWYASTAGNVDGDATGDFLVSSYKYQDSTVGGQAYLFLGSDEGGGWLAEVCTGGIDEDNDGYVDELDTDCDTGVDKMNVTVNVSTVDQDNWFDDRCRDGVDNDGDGIFDKDDADCDGGAANDADLTTYVVCDSDLSSYDSKESKNSYIHPYIKDYEYAPCDRDNVHDDFYSTDVTSPVFIQSSDRNFTINATASDANGIQSIQIEWMSGASANWSVSESKICDDAGSCTVCVEGGDCGEGNDLIDFDDLGIPEGKNNQRFFFRVIVTDNLDHSVTTGYDDNVAVSPVLDKYYRLAICSKYCHLCNNPAPLVTLASVEDPTSFCSGLDYTLHWTFNDNSPNQTYYELQVREKDDPTAPLLSTVRTSSETYARLFDGFLNGNLEYSTPTDTKVYEWRVRAYDDSTYSGALEEGCLAVSDWTPWSPVGLTFTTPIRYPTPSFTADTVNSETCAVCAYSRTVTFTSDSVVYDGSMPQTDWYIDYNTAAVVNTQSNPTSIIYTDETQSNHDVKLVVTDSAGRACETIKTISLAKGNPVWNEVAPKQDP